jgi:hypothetical protein
MEEAITAHPPLNRSIVAMILIYPITVIAGPRSVLLLISGLCVGVDAWSPEGAARNVLAGLPVLAALAALWATVTVSPERLARGWAAFVTTSTGLIMALILGGSSIGAGFTDDSIVHIQIELPLIWVFGGPVAVAVANMAWLIRARSRIGEPLPRPAQSAPARAIPRPHVPVEVVQRPTALVPYRRSDSQAARPLSS